MLTNFTSLAARQFRSTFRWYVTATQFTPVTETTKASASLNRFWKKVELATTPSGYKITLDGRPIRTPSNNTMEIPREKKLLAALIAHEWDIQDKILKTHTLPMTSLAARAIDAFNDPGMCSETRKEVLKYLDTDTICFPEEHPDALVDLQKQHWTPILDWIKAKYGVKIRIFGSVFQSTQPQETLDHFSAVLADMDIWTLAAMERATHATKSFLISLALVEGEISINQAADASRVEILSQIKRWGEVEDTHDIDHHEIRQSLGSAACILVDTMKP